LSGKHGLISFYIELSRLRMPIGKTSERG
jgi:hypothetical protein